jgi:hypothetical protein
MPREGAIIFGDLIGKLALLRIECPKCGRVGRYRVADLVARYGPDEKLFAFTDDVTANCKRRRAHSAVRRDLPGSAEGGVNCWSDTSNNRARRCPLCP